MIQKLLMGFASVRDDIEGVFEPARDLENSITDFSFTTVTIAVAVVAVLITITVLLKDRVKSLKVPLFSMIAGTVTVATFLMVGATIYLNVTAESGGPVHWHADIEYWACGNELELRDPQGFSNKIGTWTLHEHDDHRIHLEGVVVDREVDGSLGKFMHVIGGAITDKAMVVPLNADEYYENDIDGDGGSLPFPELVEPYVIDDPTLGTVASFRDGDKCGDEEADVQVFVYQFNEDNNTYTQKKLDNPKEYGYNDNPNVPPGDCIIFEFGPTRAATDKLCSQYGVRDKVRCTEFGVPEDNQSICTIEEVNRPDDTVSNDNDGSAGNPIDDLDICAPFFDKDGNPTGIEIAAYKDDGTILDPDADCDDYLKSLKQSENE